MTVASPFRRQIGWALAALVWAVLVVTPSVENALCAEDSAALAVHQNHQVQVAESDADQSEPAGHADAPGLCVHGHVHQSAPTLSDGLVLDCASAYPPPAFALVDLDGQTWRLSAGLERPPRA